MKSYLIMCEIGLETEYLKQLGDAFGIE